ncbi:hypothetical protein KVK39_03450 [Helicobacter pylori]|uniref:Uncharacterized protein n=1 Tax=Helicobacter pylori Hp A-26 TaxID=992056 RepID=J0CSS5_HELPX|nr:hypothetical protein [Helicobacter pylori]EJB76788.1 hypothetical protein HPHPA26_0679 [Helicobacter pylori Hp A-26]WQV81072.1 hypothetical protein KVK39_03450 [Helicobacter pylori]
MLLNYDFLEFENDKKVRVIDDKLHVNILDFFGIGDENDKIFLGDEISNIKDNPTEAYAAEVYAIEGAKLNRVYEKIRSGLPFGIISAFRPFKGSFTKDFTDKEQKKLIKAAKSDSLTKDFLKENDGIYRKLCNCKTFNKTFVDKFTTDKSKATMKDFMSTQGFITRYKYSYSDYMQETQRLKSFLDGKRDFLGYIQAIGYWKEKIENDLLPDKEISFFVFQNEPSKTFNLRNYLLLLARLFDQEAICYCKNAIHDKENTYKVELVSALSGDFNEVWAKFSDITFSVPSQLPQSLTHLKNKATTFFSKQPGGNCGMSFKEIDKVQIKATCMPNIVTGAFEDDIKLSIKHSQWRGYPKVFDIEKIESIEREVIEEREQYKIGSAQNLKINQIADDLKQAKVVRATNLLRALVTQKVPSDTPHDDDLD